MKKLLFLLSLPLLLMACEGEEDRQADCSTVLCAADEFYLDYKDVDGNPLIGSVFVQDSFKLSSPTSTIYLKVNSFGPENLLPIAYRSVESGADYALELSPTASDTFNFTFTTNNGPCCFTSTMSDFKYNDLTIEVDSIRNYVLVR